ncbi:hypothetical protein ACJMK2_026044 [Sinanodonta woodiana]
MEMLSVTCCQGDNQLLMWNFTKEENERITAYHWFFNEKTLICLDSMTIGFHVTDLYKGRVERIGTLDILLKNVSQTDTGEYTLYVKLDPERKRNLQGISLTVIGHHQPSQCKPIITRLDVGILSCSTPCERSSLSPEWIINGANETVGIGPYLTLDPHLNSENFFCCLRSLTCRNDIQFKLCTQNHISFADSIHGKSQIENSTNTAFQHDVTFIISVLVAIVVLALLAVLIICWTRYKRSRTLRGGNQNVNNADIISSEVLMQNLEAAKDTSDTDTCYEDAVSDLPDPQAFLGSSNTSAS